MSALPPESGHMAGCTKCPLSADTAAFEKSRHDRKRVEMLFAHLRRILKLGRLRRRGPTGAKDAFLLAATAQNLRKLAAYIKPTQLPATSRRAMRGMRSIRDRG